MSKYELERLTLVLCLKIVIVKLFLEGVVYQLCLYEEDCSKHLHCNADWYFKN